MATDFSYENVFRAPSAAALLAAYFDDDHLATQDRVAELGDRKVVDAHEDAAIRRCTWRVTSLKPLPMFVRPLVSGGRVSYGETMTWRKPDGEIDLTIQPEILGGRVQIAAVYRIADVGPGEVRRRYQGTISVNIRLLSGRIERGIQAEIEKGMPVMTACTQTWLDARYPVIAS